MPRHMPGRTSVTGKGVNLARYESWPGNGAVPAAGRLLPAAGTQRVIALFLVTYCLVASFTEDGLGSAASYMLDLTLAASCLVPYARARKPAAAPRSRLV